MNPKTVAIGHVKMRVCFRGEGRLCLRTIAQAGLDNPRQEASQFLALSALGVVRLCAYSKRPYVPAMLRPMIRSDQAPCFWTSICSDRTGREDRPKDNTSCRNLHIRVHVLANHVPDLLHHTRALITSEVDAAKFFQGQPALLRV
jgi:hypothetical protein